MNQDTEQHNFWTMARHGWTISIIIGITVLLVRFKALVPLVWQMVVKNDSVHTFGQSVNNLAPSTAIIGGCILFIYAVRIGYKRINEELIINDSSASVSEYKTSKSSIVLNTIGRISLGINAPILYWAAFLFILLPQLVKLPNDSLRLGTTGLAGAFIGMAIIIVLATHIGLMLTKYSLRSLSKTNTPAPVIDTSNVRPQQQSLAPPQQQNTYLQQPVNTLLTGTDYQPISYSRSDSYRTPAPQTTIPNPSNIPTRNETAPSVSPYLQQPSYTPQPHYSPGPTNDDPRNQSAQEQSSTDPDKNLPQSQ